MKLKSSFYKLESKVRGVANKRRIEILLLLEKNPELSVSEIAEKIGLAFKSCSSQLLRLLRSGLIMKRQENLTVRHALTKTGKRSCNFIRDIDAGNG